VLEQQGICQRMMTQPFNDLDEDAGRRVSERIALYVNNRQSIN